MNLEWRNRYEVAQQAAHDAGQVALRYFDTAVEVEWKQNLTPVTIADLERKLADLEQKSGIQLVVATVPSLDGQEIEPYANQLFRAWKLGEAKQNNGVLLLIAPNQRRMRIEVGYGLEGTLTDAVSSLIISNAIAPRFRAVRSVTPSMYSLAMK